MKNEIVCVNCMYGYNKSWVVEAVKNKVVTCPKCKDKFIFDDDLNLKELGFKDCGVLKC